MRPERIAVVVCSLAIIGGGCGADEDKDTLSVAETGTELSTICSQASAAGTGLNGDVKNDAPILRKFVPAYERAIEQMRDLAVAEELADTRDAFVAFSQRQLPVMRQAQTLAEQGDVKKYLAKVREVESGTPENDKLARKLGASGCGGDG